MLCRARLRGVVDSVAGSGSAFWEFSGEDLGGQSAGYKLYLYQRVLAHKSLEPVSKSKLKTLPGLPIVTGTRYSESFWISLAPT